MLQYLFVADVSGVLSDDVPDSLDGGLPLIQDLVHALLHAGGAAGAGVDDDVVDLKNKEMATLLLWETHVQLLEINGKRYNLSLQRK